LYSVTCHDLGLTHLSGSAFALASKTTSAVSCEIELGKAAYLLKITSRKLSRKDERAMSLKYDVRKCFN